MTRRKIILLILGIFIIASVSVPKVSQELSKKALYIGAGVVFGSASHLAQVGWGICQLFPGASTLGKESLLLSDLCSCAAQHAFAQGFKKSAPSSQTSWHQNREALSQIPASSEEEKQLLSFLERRWLAKANGFFSAEVDWACPCFGFSVQVHPESTNSYARDPANTPTQTYLNRIKDSNLILTRPFDVHEYLPDQTILDLTHLSPEEQKRHWSSLSKKPICIERIQQGEVGGIRILPFASPKETAAQYRYLLERVSHFGLTANPIELDRWPTSFKTNTAPIALKPRTKGGFLSSLDSFERNWQSNPQKSLMVKGVLQTLKGLLDVVGEEKWEEIMNCPTRSSVVQLSFSRIEDQLKRLLQKETPFFHVAALVEQIHENLTALLEIFSPFSHEDFPPIYRSLLTSIPPHLKPLTACGVHSSGMTTVTGIFKAAEKAKGKPLRVLYGENTYFECMYVANEISHASPIEEATEKDWEEVDLILAQFNPVLLAPRYEIEKVAEVLRRSLDAKQGKPLTLALDCTIDYINSPRVASLLDEFQKEIETGKLNIICYRSGLKFDLFGMDNFAGAPYFMIHNRDEKWASFDSLLTDPVLKTDRLSLNWFCLAYQTAAPYLELYRKQIFENTRALLNKIPSRLFDPNGRYRVLSFAPDADPAFIALKVSGPFHQIRAATLVGGSLYLRCMEGGHPVFYRRSIGFYHPNFGIIFEKESTTVRLTIGLDPDQVDVLTRCFEQIDALNEESHDL